LKVRRAPVLQPVLFAILPVLFLYAHNIRELSLDQLILPLIIAISVSLVLWLVLRLTLRDGTRAAVVGSLFWIWFFSFGHLHRAIAASPDEGLAAPRTAFFVAAYWAVLLVGIGLLVARKRRLATLSAALTVMALALVLFQIVGIGTYELRRVMTYRRVRQTPTLAPSANATSQVFPNIYYIILDGYARADVLKRLYDYDNAPFLQYLEGKGFQVARRATANYSQTVLSVASTLNLEYLDPLAAQVGYDSNDRAPLARMINHNRLFEFLRGRGYCIVAFSSEYGPTDIQSADLYLSDAASLTEFQSVLLGATPLPVLFAGSERARLDRPHAQRVLYAFDHLGDTRRLKPPVFVYAHILCPHPPFVFDAKGNVTTPEQMLGPRRRTGARDPLAEQVAQYVEQTRFVNRKVETVVDTLLNGSEWPTVIILQSDHGPSSRTDWENVARTDVGERMAVLLACRLPAAPGFRLDDDLSTVNVFRIVLDSCFGTDLGRLPNQNYYSTPRHPYRFIRVTDDVRRVAGDRSVRRPFSQGTAARNAK
jgi:hypothetical protein